MANISRFFQEGAHINYTPTAATYAGNIIQIGSVCAVVAEDIAASALGAVAITGVIRAPNVGLAGNVGDNVWWDANGTPYGGTNDGACTVNAAAGDWWVGTLTKAAAANAATMYVALNVQNPNLPAWVGKTHFTTAADLTLVAATHSGGVIHVTKDAGTDTTITLPNGVCGMDFIIQNDEADGGNGCIVDPTHATEDIEGANLTIADTKTAINTLATSIRGDFLHLVCQVATASWKCVAKRGIWVTS